MGEETRESMAFDVVIVGAGPSGLACAIRMKQLADEAGQELHDEWCPYRNAEVRVTAPTRVEAPTRGACCWAP
ncbi:MAG: hypothetical protein AAF352_06385, partial [Pseudomonadota bacterium]